mgnify:CR=1 FL=1
MLKELAKNHSKWVSFALKICGDEELAKDLTQEMYIKVHLKQPEYIESGYVYRIIANLFMDMHRGKKLETVSIDASHHIQNEDSTFEPDDYQQTCLDRFEDLYWTDQDLIRESYDRSLRQIESAYPMINFTYAHRQITKSVKHILGDNYETQYKNTRRK